MKKRKKRLNLKVILILLVIVIAVIAIPSLKQKEKPQNIHVEVTPRDQVVLKKLELDNYTNLYNITNNYITVVKDNNINLVDLNKESIIELSELINDYDHFKLVIDHLLHQKYNCTDCPESFLM